MDPIETLMTEHRVIERVLDALVAFVEDVRRREATEALELGRFVTFIREFADACHHGKEEDILFTAMVEHGFPREGGPIAVMLFEHDRGRALVSTLQGYVDRSEEWGDRDRQGIFDTAHAYAEMLRAHIQKEDSVLYPLAERHLPPEEMGKIGEDFERFESETMGNHERLHALAEGLVSRHAPMVNAPAEDRGAGPG